MSQGRVLVVDDEVNLRKSVGKILTKAGYDVVQAGDGQEAITTIRSGDNPIMIDAIICDMNMPNMDGKEAIAWFRSQFPSVPIVVLTGNPQFQDAASLMKDGVVDYLAKPFEPQALLTAVAKCVEGHVFHH
jgi:two-component system chemotaxis response regulator CheY